MRPYDFENSIGYSVWLAAHSWQRAMNEELTPHGITYRQCQVLALLLMEGPSAQAELAARLNVEPPTLSGILRRMERDGLLTREACPEDQRRNLVRLQPQAQVVWSTITDCAERVRARVTRGMTAQEVKSLKRLLATVHGNLGLTKTTDLSA